MKKIVIAQVLFLMLTGVYYTTAQTSGGITVGGDFDKFYPVTWYDGNWSSVRPTELHISRYNVHDNSTWRGSLMSTFTFHVTRWGHGSEFINALSSIEGVPLLPVGVTLQLRIRTSGL